MGKWGTPSHGSWTKVWLNLLLQHRRSLDLSCVQLDGSHTPCKRGGMAVEYHGRKAAMTINTLYLADNQGDRRTGKWYVVPAHKKVSIAIYFSYKHYLRKFVNF